MMEKKYINRLKKLAKHLRFGKLIHSRFSFACYNDETEPKCGTRGCAIGECPALWKVWTFNDRGYPVLNLKRVNDSPEDSGKLWFGLDGKEYGHLFLPHSQRHEYGGQHLTGTASKEIVAKGIEAFIKLKEAS